MLSDADSEIVQRDTELPGLGLLLDTERLAAALAELPGLASLRRVEMSYLRYKPGISGLAGLRLHLDEGVALDRVAMLLPPARHVEAWARPRWQQQVASGSPDAPRRIEAAGLVLLTPAHDRRLRVMRRLAVPAKRDALLGHLLPALVSDLPMTLETLRYKPERRLVARVLQGGAPVAVLRACLPASFSKALIGATYSAAQGGARLLGASAEHSLLASAWVPGQPLCPESTALAGPATMRRLGAALAKLHTSSLVHPLPRSREHENAAVQRALEGLAWLCPALLAHAQALARRAAGVLAGAPCRPVFIHGDFSIDQVVADGEALHLIDWDSAAHGDPAADLGSLWARLELQVIERVVGRAEADEAVAAFIAGHAAAVEHAGQAAPCAEVIAAQAAAHVLKLLAEPFRKREPHWPAQAEALLERAGALLECHGHTRTLTTADLAMPQLAQAADAAAMHGPVATALGLSVGQIPPPAVRLLRHKPGRRALLEYTLQLPGGETCELIGKLRAKGLDRHGFEVQQALWRSGFREPGVVVPEPLGCLPEQAMWLQRRHPGRPAADDFVPGGDTALASRVATALAALHRCGPETARHWTLDHELSLLRDRLRQAAGLHPALAARIEALATACGRLGASLPHAQVTGIHRDFYPDQVLLDGDTLVLLDFDLYAQGDPALDVGNFIAHLSEQALRRHDDATALAHHEEALVQRYLALAPRVQPASVEGWTTLSLARHVYLSTQFAERRHLTETLLSLCEQRIIS